ncbi:MAG: LytTR family DNA-binding domain-containing protein [Clostridium perfringens]|nr:LytTR family DNA-binding domain-containing protein [Clostridium perfringens]
MLKICLCDNDKNILNCYSKKVTDLLNNIYFTFKLETFTSGESLIFKLEDDPNKFDIIIIDIIMKGIDGIETSKILRNYGYEGIIIFLTSSKEFAFDSFKVEPFNYILKNSKNNRFDNIFLKAAKKVHKKSRKNIINLSKPQNKIIDLDTIIYMETLSKKVLFHKLSGEIEEVNCSFKDIIENVERYGLFRCHKSYIVNINYVKTFNKLECKLYNDVIIPLGRKYSKEFRNIILQNEFSELII